MMEKYSVEEKSGEKNNKLTVLCKCGKDLLQCFS